MYYFLSLLSHKHTLLSFYHQDEHRCGLWASHFNSLFPGLMSWKELCLEIVPVSLIWTGAKQPPPLHFLQLDPHKPHGLIKAKLYKKRVMLRKDTFSRAQHLRTVKAVVGALTGAWCYDIKPPNEPRKAQAILRMHVYFKYFKHACVNVWGCGLMYELTLLLDPLPTVHQWPIRNNSN